MKKENNPEILNDFLNYLLAIKGYSINTINEYNRDLLIFFNFIKEYFKIKVEIKKFNQLILLQVRRADIIAFLVYCNYSKNNNPYTRQRKLTSIRSFYKWLLGNLTNECYIENPTEGIGNIKKTIRLPKYLTLEQAKNIQKTFNKQNSKYSIRNNAIISLFLSTGLRVSELISIKMQDINFTNNNIKIIGKGNKERTVYFSNACKKILKEYISIKNKGIKTSNLSDPLFISNRNQKMNRYTVYYICKNAFKNININELHYSPHTLRHTAATIIYKYVKPDILLLKEFLGHASINSTEIYSHIDNARIKEAVDKNPLANFNIKEKEQKAA